MAAATEYGITVWSLPQGQKVLSLGAERGQIRCLAFGRNPCRVGRRRIRPSCWRLVKWVAA
jgi:hypothetical protein